MHIFHVVRNEIWGPYLDPGPSLAFLNILSNIKKFQCWIKNDYLRSSLDCCIFRANIIVSVMCYLILRSDIVRALWKLSKIDLEVNQP